MKRFALAGNPNSGKTTLFNSLTGSNAHVGNWPGVTVDKREGICRLGKQETNIIDLPGTYSLSPYTPEEVIARNYIINEKPDCIINVIDVTNLERNLYLTTQLLEMDVPLIIALNMMDVLEKNGKRIDIKQLEKAIGVPVVPISALRQKHLGELIDKAIKTSEQERKGFTVLKESPINHLITDLNIAFKANNISNSLYHAIKLAELDEVEIQEHPSLLSIVEDFKKVNVDNSFSYDYEALIADARYKYITKHYSIYVINEKVIKEERTSYRIDKILTNKWFGIPIFLLIMFFIFHFTFSENLFFLRPLIHTDSFSFLKDNPFWSSLSGAFYSSDKGIASIGVMLSNLVSSSTDALSHLIRVWLSFSPSWVSGFICDGVLGGVFSVLNFLPQILLLFFFFSILEDSGYMARIAFILDRFFRFFSLSGRAFLPLIMGFGCSVPAMINTRTIKDEKERVATLRIIPFFSCGAKLPLLTAISGCIASSFGFVYVDLITMGMYLLGISVALLTLIFMKYTFNKNHSSTFLMELPDYHLPQFKSTMLLIWDKAKHFIKKAFTIILASTIVIWFLSHFSIGGPTWVYLSEDDLSHSILASVGQIIQPIFSIVGFGQTPYGWVFVVAILSGLIAKENALSVFVSLSASILTAKGIAINGDAGALFIDFLKSSDALFASNGIWILISFIAFNMLTIPCVAAIASAKAELPKGKFLTTIILWVGISFIVCSAIYLISSYPWSAFIYLGAIVILIAVIIVVYKNKRIRKGAM